MSKSDSDSEMSDSGSESEQEDASMQTSSGSDRSDSESESGSDSASGSESGSGSESSGSDSESKKPAVNVTAEENERKRKRREAGAKIRAERRAIREASEAAAVAAAARGTPLTSTILNANIKDLNPDHYYHLGLSSSSQLRAMFGDVRFVILSGSPVRALETIHKVVSALNINLPLGCAVTPIGKTERYSLYKAGPVLSVSHGMGKPSISIMLHEITKLLAAAGVIDATTYIRVGTSGGLGCPPGTVIVSSGCVNGTLEPTFPVVILGKTVHRPCKIDADLVESIMAVKVPQKSNYKMIKGITCSTDDFYEGQGRLDGAICEYTQADKMAFLKKAHAAGVRNIEMEGDAIVAFCTKLNIKCAVICATIVDRLQGDQVTSTPAELVGFTDNAVQVTLRFIQKSLNIKPGKGDSKAMRLAKAKNALSGAAVANVAGSSEEFPAKTIANEHTGGAASKKAKKAAIKAKIAAASKKKTAAPTPKKADKPAAAAAPKTPNGSAKKAAATPASDKKKAAPATDKKAAAAAVPKENGSAKKKAPAAAPVTPAAAPVTPVKAASVKKEDAKSAAKVAASEKKAKAKAEKIAEKAADDALAAIAAAATPKKAPQTPAAVKKESKKAEKAAAAAATATAPSTPAPSAKKKAEKVVLAVATPVAAPSAPATPAAEPMNRRQKKKLAEEAIAAEKAAIEQKAVDDARTIAENRAADLAKFNPDAVVKVHRPTKNERKAMKEAAIKAALTAGAPAPTSAQVAAGFSTPAKAAAPAAAATVAATTDGKKRKRSSEDEKKPEEKKTPTEKRSKRSKKSDDMSDD